MECMYSRMNQLINFNLKQHFRFKVITLIHSDFTPFAKKTSKLLACSFNPYLFVHKSLFI